jgi:ribonucleotide monophosphatase NagD (HAD superfamily)
MIGDRLDTDIEGAQRAGLLGALVLTGAHRTEDIGAIQPDGVYDSLADLQAAWQRT